MFDQLAKASIFFRDDWRCSYYQIRVKDNDIKKIAFKVTQSECVVLHFWLTNATVIFIGHIEQNFHTIINNDHDNH